MVLILCEPTFDSFVEILECFVEKFKRLILMSVGDLAKTEIDIVVERT